MRINSTDFGTGYYNIPGKITQQKYNTIKPLKYDTVSFCGVKNKTLNPQIWDMNKQLKPEVSQKLIEISEAFKKTLSLPFKMKDLVIMGSMTDYNYKENSDIDLHLVTYFDEYDIDDNFLYDYFNSKRLMFNHMHDISIYSHPVEVYVQNREQNIWSNSKYSVLNNKWLKEPDINKIPADCDIAKTQEYLSLKQQIEECLKNKSYNDILKMIGEIFQYRKAGLKEEGDFSLNNLIYKQLRDENYIPGLFRAAQDALGKMLTLK